VLFNIWVATWVKVTDNSSNTSGFTDGANTANEYIYDNKGNVTADANKGINANGITYNHLNLPLTITKGTAVIRYFYTATGQKVKKTITKNGTTVTTDYLDGFQYKNTVLEFFGHAEGFVASGSYVYQYKDQLGNVRMSFDKGQNGTARILDENHYYPYGLKHAGYGSTNLISNNAAHKYRYNSREWQDEEALNLTAMDFRMYDNALGKFYGMDALSEKNHYLSPFQFGNGNPVFWADPTGLDSGMQGWLQEMWNKSGSGVTTWTNIGGAFESNNGDIVQYQSIDAGVSSGGGSGAAAGGGNSGGFGVGGNIKNIIAIADYGNKPAGADKDGNKRDDMQETIESAIKFATADLIIIFFKNLTDLKEALEKSFGNGDVLGSFTLIAHGGYNNTGPILGDHTSITTFDSYGYLGEIINKYSNSESKILLITCNSGAGSNPEFSQAKIQHLADVSGCSVIAPRSWSIVQPHMFKVDGYSPTVRESAKPYHEHSRFNTQPNAFEFSNTYLRCNPYSCTPQILLKSSVSIRRNGVIESPN
jgi:RHS repeat-associated protein